MSKFYHLTLGEIKKNIVGDEVNRFSDIIPHYIERQGIKLYRYDPIPIIGEIFNNKMYDVITNGYIPYVKQKKNGEIPTYRGLCYSEARPIKIEVVADYLKRMNKEGVRRYEKAMYDYTNKLIKEYDLVQQKFEDARKQKEEDALASEYIEDFKRRRKKY